MKFEDVQLGIRSLNDASRRKLQTWLREEFREFGDRPELTKDELDTIIAVRNFELSGKEATSVALSEELGISTDNFSKRVTRLNATVYGPYLASHRIDHTQTHYSTIYDAIVRQPSTAMMALMFEYSPGLTAANRERLEQFGAERDISDISYYLDYLLERQYFSPRGNSFGPGLRLTIEGPYLKWLANKWPVQSLVDRLKVERYKNSVLWHIWQAEDANPLSKEQATHDVIVTELSKSSDCASAPRLIDHSIRSLVSEGAIKERLDAGVNGPVYFLNERDEPGHSVVTWTGTAALLAGLAENIVPRDERHAVTIEQLVAFGLTLGLSLEAILQAVTFTELAGYIEVFREGDRIVRLWRSERLMSHLEFVKRVAALYGK